MQIVNNQGTRITSVAEWLTHAPPAGGHNHWRDFRSAKEIAQAYFRTGTAALPEETQELFNHRNETRGFVFEKGVAEMKMSLDTFKGNTRNSDLTLYGVRATEKIVVGIESKADEQFDTRTVQSAIESVATKDESNLPTRIAALSNAIFGRTVDEGIGKLRYQLLASVGALLIEADKQKAAVCVFVVHEFISLTLNFDKLTDNANDLKAFTSMFPRWAGRELRTGQLLPAISCGAYRTKLLLGKVRTLLPLESRPNSRPAPGMQDNRQYLA